ncbi:hypothetical protein OHC33_000582 [Knufia fluminis]|uniref:Uncharacterized protein n=1 Tax=Knufia fluminis TaxID=191047 RepID=A0AAN8ELS3_9EURO|nr:hypothetical protein OHC33_000582 [Knufia fluminis]
MASLDESQFQDYGDNAIPLVELSAQLLACCQSLYKEAWPVLYGENSLKVVCQSSPPHYHTCYILGAGIELLCNADDMPADDYDLLSLARQKTDNIDSTKRLVVHWEGLSKVQNIELSIGHSLQEEIFIASRVLHKLVLNKHVLLKLLPKNIDWDMEDELQVDFRSWENYCLKGCRIFRCRSIRFEGNRSDVSELTREIEGHSDPPEDLFAMWRKADDFVLDMPRWSNEDEASALQLLAGFGDHRDNARMAVQQYHVSDARKYIRMFFKQAHDWTNAWAERETIRARKRYEADLSKVEDDTIMYSGWIQEVSDELDVSMTG